MRRLHAMRPTAPLRSTASVEPRHELDPPPTASAKRKLERHPDQAPAAR